MIHAQQSGLAIEITSAGGLPYGLELDDFFAGHSAPRNKEIMRVFRDLEIVEHLGSGIPRILAAYGREAFNISRNFMRLAFPYTKPIQPQHVATEKESSEKSSEKILRLLRGNGQITIAGLSAELGITSRAIEKNIKKLQDTGRLKRVGPDKGGHWEVLDDNA